MKITTTSTPKNRYSDSELEEFKQIILRKLTKAKNDLKFLLESREENGEFIARQEKFIKSLENALIRIGNKTYGICRITGELIPPERLRSVPHATTTVIGKIKDNKEKPKKSPKGGNFPTVAENVEAGEYDNEDFAEVG